MFWELACGEGLEQSMHLRALGQEWREDASNAVPKYKRNRVRLQLVPLLEELAGGGDEVLAKILSKIVVDDTRQAEVFAKIADEAFGVVPDQMARAIADRIQGFAIPVVDLPSKANSTEALAAAGIYDEDQQREKVFKPVLARWNFFDRDDLGDEGKKARDEIAHLA